MLSRGAIQALRITTRVHSKMLLRRQGLVGARWHGAIDPAERTSGTAFMGSPGELIPPAFLRARVALLTLDRSEAVND